MINKPSNAAILTWRELEGKAATLEARAEGFDIVGEHRRASADRRNADRARFAADHFAKTEGIKS